MREKTIKTIVSFACTSDAMAMESSAQEKGFPGRLIPVPSEITAGCGLAWCADENHRQAVLNALDVFELVHEGVYEVEMY